MQPNSEPSAADVALVAQSMGAPAPAAPEPVAAPAPQQQPEPITPQAAPSQAPSDPFATLFASEPEAAPAPQPVSQPEPVAPAAPVEAYAAPAPQAPAQPAQPVAPAAPAAPVNEYQTYDEYMSQVLATVPESPAAPNIEDVDQSDPAAIKGFFDDLMNTAVARAQAESQRNIAIQTAEKRAWDEAMDKYGSLRTNKELRDTVHNIRMANFQRGIAMTPTQAAESLLKAMGQQYRQGVADTQVITTYEQVQPTGGNGTSVPTTLDTQNALTAVQTGGESALAAILDQEIKAGRL